MKPGATTPHLHPGTIFCLPEPSHIELPCCEEATPRLCQHTSTAWDQPFQRHPFRCRGTKERMIRSSKMKESPMPKARPTSIVHQGRTVIHDKMFDKQIKSLNSTNFKKNQNISLCSSSKPTHPKKKGPSKESTTKSTAECRVTSIAKMSSIKERTNLQRLRERRPL